MSNTELSVAIETQPGLKELEGLIAALKKVSKVSLDACLSVKQLLLGEDGSLKKGVIYFGFVAAAGADNKALELRVSDQFREGAAALIAAYLK
ncbi:hypothetical protein LCH33_002146 [Pseudomonas amygdali]|uniref:Uncharacterized protein n=1 Tax=Pseudomonas amygdali pv. hibisci TaxID=251723 RepID=A0AB34UAZ2_PSEA0|nr:hypothetical protein [Pseudomonas amygdali]KPX57017.1 Uncharacterized protein ALO67_02277 [Pseudomonas amygdali pv. hibisci]RMN61818.1 hypothetical protein ALQ57_02632 [Pseudomonas amygdali pv. hibisci]UBT78782.1 hypothetical protein LCH33_002146 [Pseudomonas amygdali]